MILALLLNVFLSVIAMVLDVILPNQELLPSAFNEAWSWFTNFLANILWVLPGNIGSELLLITNIVLITEAAILSWGILNWILNKLRGSGN